MRLRRIVTIALGVGTATLVAISSQAIPVRYESTGAFSNSSAGGSGDTIISVGDFFEPDTFRASFAPDNLCSPAVGIGHVSCSSLPPTKPSLNIQGVTYEITDTGVANTMTLPTHGQPSLLGVDLADPAAPNAPEPAFYLLTGSGLAGLLAMAIRRRKQTP